MSSAVTLDNKVKGSVFCTQAVPRVFEYGCGRFLNQMRPFCKVTYSTLVACLKSTKEADLERCIQILKDIPSLSQKQRMNWTSWYRLHYYALDKFIFSIPCVSSKFMMPMPWHPMQVRLSQYVTSSGLRTSCGLTNHIVLTKLLGPKAAVLLSFNDKTHQLQDLDFTLKNHKPVLLSFMINACDLATEKGTPVHYGGHVWTVFRATPDRYLLITSYLHKQNADVRELNVQEMRSHIKDMHKISNAKKWTTKVDAVYKKWFGVSYADCIGLKPNRERPWRVTFKSVHPDIRNVQRIEKQHLQAMQRPYFPKNFVLEKGEKLPIDDERYQDIFSHDSPQWWLDSGYFLSFREAMSDYVRWLRGCEVNW